MDFSLRTYLKLLDLLNRKDYSFQPIKEIFGKSGSKTIILRHDIDKLPQNALAFARIEQEMGINGTYFFRIVSESFDAGIVEEIAKLGHEIGYHYEDVDLAYRQLKAEGGRQKAAGGIDEETERRRGKETGRLGDFETERLSDDPTSLKLRRTKETMRLGDDVTMRPNDGKIKSQREEDPATSNQQPGPLFQKSIELFDNHLSKLRKYADIRTICMHGSPLSRWDSRLLWKYYNYHEFGIEVEPYFDVSFEDVLYLTDTGRRWDGTGVSVRDKGLGIRNQGLVTREKGFGIRDQGLGNRDQEPGIREKGFDNKDEGFGDPYEDWVVKPKLGSAMNMTQKAIDFQNQYNFRTTKDIIRAAENDELPDKIMFTFHPQRWTDRPGPWVRELVWQNAKNVGKRVLVKVRD